MKKDATIGITGGIGSGKSVVSRILRCNGYTVYDCDTEAKYLMNHNQDIKILLEEKLGKDIYHNGELNRRKLSQELFCNNLIRDYVNEVVHKEVRKDILQKRDETKGLFFIESAIISTGGIAEKCNEIWIVTSPYELRIQRVKTRDNFSEEEIIRRIESQKGELEALDKRKVIFIENDEYHPILSEILFLINKNIHNQTYKIIC